MRTDRPIYRQFLSNEFERRKRRNSSYSLRAYARDIGVHFSKLSRYLKGESGISGETAVEIAPKLNLSPVEIQLFVYSAESLHARSELSREVAKGKLKELLGDVFNQINIEKFNTIRDWYHFAILELTEIEGFRSDMDWVAKVLGISVDDVRSAVERLLMLELLEVRDEKWFQTQKTLETPTDIESQAIQEYHRQIMDIAKERLDKVPLAQRELGSLIFAVDQDLIPEFKELLYRLQKETASLVERSSRKNALYMLNYQLMPISEGEL